MATTATAPHAASGGAGDLLERLRRATRTTPGWLRVVSVAVVALMVLLAGIAAVGISARRASIDRTATRLEPLVVASQDAHASLVEADAAAAAAFLSGGVEDATQRTAYSSALARAARHLQAAAESGSGDATTQKAVREASEQVSVYAGLVERARSNNRLGYPVGAAYLRVGSDLMHDEIIPAVERLGTRGDASLDDEYDNGQSTNAGIGIVLAIFLGGAVLLLVVLQRFLAARTRRLLNPLLVAATAVAVMAGLWLAAGLVRQADALGDARVNAYELISAASRARSTAFDARADENLALIARGNGARFNDEFATAVGVMGNESAAALGEVVESAKRSDERGDALRAASAWAAYLDAHARVVELVANGDQLGAVASSLGPSQEAFEAFDNTLSGLIRANQAEFTRGVDAADGAVAPLIPVALIAALLVSLLTLLGVAPRIAEYR
ncbi:MAG: hypothetical protein Q8K63_03125 [Acidimicrobiales bacterium]|nr:hypothetical protein [Acidimicrobiales bacterium]